MSFLKRQLLTEELRQGVPLTAGTVIRFKMPLFNFDRSGDFIDTDPPYYHYAVVIGKTGQIKGKEFNGHDMIKMHHFNKVKLPDPPFLKYDSFIDHKPESDLDEIKAFYKDGDDPKKKYRSCPNENNKQKTICSFHDKCKVPYYFVGTLTDKDFTDFKIYYNTRKNGFNHLLIDKSGNSYFVRHPYDNKGADKPYLKNKNGELVSRASINEAFEQQPGAILMIIPDEYAENLVFKENPVAIRRVIPHDDYTIHLFFSNGESGVYDVLPLIIMDITDNDAFASLGDLSLFNNVKNYGDFVAWNDDMAIGIDELYNNCMTVSSYNRWRLRKYHD